MVLMKAVMAVITTVWLKVTCLLSAESISQRRCQYANKCGIEETVRNPLVFLNTVRIPFTTMALFLNTVGSFFK